MYFQITKKKTKDSSSNVRNEERRISVLRNIMQVTH